MSKIFIAKTKDEIRACYPVMLQLRPTYSEADFLQQVEKQLKKNFHLAYLQEGNTVCSVAGYRYAENLAWGKFLYVDDLITDSEQRSRGYGKDLLDWLVGQAKDKLCSQVHLDSGIQRMDAHRFYQREGFVHTGHHYAFGL